MESKKNLIIIVVLLIGLVGGSALLLNKNKDKTDEIVKEAKEIEKTEDKKEETDEKEEVEKIEYIDFTVEDWEGEEVSLSDKIGKPIIINFWATWCGFCIDEMPVFNDMYHEYIDDVEFMMIDAVGTQGETVEGAKEYIEKNEFDFPVYFDIDLNAVSDYGIPGFPATIAIDKDGYIAFAKTGALDEETLKAIIGLINE